MSDEPVVVEPLVGFRKFLVLGAALISPVAMTRWEGPVLEAQCQPPIRAPRVREPHEAPHPSCTCGVYALHTPYWMHGPPRGAWAVVAMWGRVEVHRLGMRSQFARVCALGMPSGPGTSAFEFVAERLGIDLVPRDELEAAASDYGRPVDAWMLPETA